MSRRPELIKADLGPYAGRLHKYDLFNDEEHRLDTSKGLKFIHFNNFYGSGKIPKHVFKKYQSRTVAVLALSPNGIRKLAADYLSLEPDTQLYTQMTVGVTLLSKDDTYCKKIGRDEAVKKMTDIDLEVKGMVINPTHIYIKLAEYKGVVLTIRLNKATGFSTVVGSLANT